MSGIASEYSAPESAPQTTEAKTRFGAKRPNVDKRLVPPVRRFLRWFPRRAESTPALDAVSGWLVMAMWATLGAALGVVLRAVALPIGLGVVWILGVENLVSAVAGSSLTALKPLRDVLPGVSSGSLIMSVLPAGTGSLPPGVQSTVSGERGLLTVAAYAVLAALALVAVARRRDVA